MQLARKFSRAARPHLLIALAAVFFFLIAAGQRTDAHKPVTSQYDYNRDVFPLLRDHCGACHVPGGPAPMSLVTYKDAVPWAESIRDELTAGRMPPWPVDPMSPQVQGAHPISASDVDKIVVWASGGTPQGDPAANLPAVTFNAQWKLGPPDLKMEMDAGHTLRPGAIEDTVEMSLPVALGGTKWVKAVDLHARQRIHRARRRNQHREWPRPGDVAARNRRHSRASRHSVSPSPRRENSPGDSLQEALRPGTAISLRQKHHRPLLHRPARFGPRAAILGDRAPENRRQSPR